MDFMSTIKPIFVYQKNAFNAGYNTMIILQGQAEKLAADLLEKSSMPSGIMDVFEKTFSEYKKSQGNLKKLMEESFSNFETMLALDGEEPHTPVSKKTQEKMPA